jgi:uncharacterized protein YjbI with pentapeptide repeats
MRWPSWTGLGERRFKKSANEEVQPPKTAWDVLQLLIVPAILVAIALVFNAAQASRDQKHQDAQLREDRALAEAAREDSALDGYVGTMGKLILDRHLLTSKPESPVRAVARTETLAIVRRLNGSRKGEVVQFLSESGLLRVKAVPGGIGLGRWTEPVVSLTGADLRDIDLTEAHLFGKSPQDLDDLEGADLRGARFDRALLYYVTFGRDFFPSATDLRDASFNGAVLQDTSLNYANLHNSSFKHALFDQASFRGANLTEAAFDQASVASAPIRASFAQTCLNGARFVGASFSAGEGTQFYGARGHDIDFSDARGLSKVVFGRGDLKRVRFGNATERPKTVADPKGFQPSFSPAASARCSTPQLPRPK